MHTLAVVVLTLETTDTVADDPDDDVPIFAARHQQLQASDSLRKVEDDPDDDVPLFAARQ